MPSPDFSSPAADAAIAAVRQSDPASWLAASPCLAGHARAACQSFFALSSPYASACPISRLLTDGFHAEQVWQQIDLQAGPLLSSLRRRIARFQAADLSEPLFHRIEKNLRIQKKLEEEEEEEEEAEEEEEEDEEEEAAEEEEEEDDEEEASPRNTLLEDRFLKLHEMEKFLDQAEAEDTLQDHGSFYDSGMDNEEELGEEEDDSQMVSRLPFLENAEQGGCGYSEDIKYKNFFDNDRQKHNKLSDHSTGKHGETYFNSDKVSDINQAGDHVKQKTEQMESMSTHERQLEKIFKRVKQLEMASLEPKSWTLQGEVTAAKRPKNSALEVDLDFEHNARPAPVITEEVTASLEDMIRSRIAEERFDDVQRSISASVLATKEQIEVDENKSKKGLGELYEEEYMETTGLAPVFASALDEVKKEANALFKVLCMKLDALSHFHFTPKPPIEEMAVQSNLPALAMEEVAPLAVSDANMLAPEEIFVGGVNKTDKEMTHSERRRRRAKRKRFLKDDKTNRIERKCSQNEDTSTKKRSGQIFEKGDHRQESKRWKPAKAFADLDKAKDAKKEHATQRSHAPHPAFLKL